MTGLPVVTPKQVLRALYRAGFEDQRQSGSHITLWHPVSHRRVTIPLHGHDLKRGMLYSILKQSGLSAEELRELL